MMMLGPALFHPRSALLALLHFLVLFALFINCSDDEEKNRKSAEELPRSVTQMANRHKKLTDSELEDVMREFGSHIGKILDTQIGELIGDLKNVPNPQALNKLKEAQKDVSKDAETRIKLAASNNANGEMTQSFASAANSARAFLGQASARMQAAGKFIDNRLNSLGNLIPTTVGLIKKVPDRIHRLMKWPSFLEFKVKHNKWYRSLREELYRQMVYMADQTTIGIHNMRFLLGKVTYLRRSTQFSDITVGEYRDIYDNPLAEGYPEELKNRNHGKRRSQNENDIDTGSTDGEQSDADSSSQSSKRLKRDKRDTIVRKSSELEEEDEEMIDEDEHDEFNQPDDSHQLKNELEESEFKAVDQYASEFDDNARFEDIDELNDILDDVIFERREFRGIDLRDTGCIIKPENQWTCGNCYAQVVSAVASYYNCMDLKKERPGVRPLRYSARYLADCGVHFRRKDDDRPGINGCRGGLVSRTIEFIRTTGTYNFIAYEVARNSENVKPDTCPFPVPEKFDDWALIPVPFYKQNRYVNIGLDGVDLHLRTVGPVFISMRTWPGFKSQGSGIFDGDDDGFEQAAIHSMLIVGHDRDRHGRDFYILWNSHGIAWGELGYMRIYADALERYCVYYGGLIDRNMPNFSAFKKSVSGV